VTWQIHAQILLSSAEASIREGSGSALSCRIKEKRRIDRLADMPALKVLETPIGHSHV